MHVRVRAKNLFANVYITPKEILELLHFSDSIDIPTIEETVRAMYRGIWWYTGLEFLAAQLMVFCIVYASNFYDHAKPFEALGTAVILLFLLRVVVSVILNGHVSVPFQKLTLGKINTFMHEFRPYLGKDANYAMNELYANYRSYGYDVAQIFNNLIDLYIVLASTLLTQTHSEGKAATIILTVLVLVTMGISGYLYNNASLKVREQFVQDKEPTRRDYLRRIHFPLAYNQVNSVVLPLCIIFFGVFKLADLIPQIAILLGLTSFGWSLVNKILEFTITKRALLSVTANLREVTRRFVVNDEGYREVCSLTKPSEATLLKSGKNKSLVLRNYVPMVRTNGMETKRAINFEFVPGLYQINGKNGVGKSTFLESLSFPGEELVEPCAGEAALMGKPLFEFARSLNDHRKVVRYISKHSQIPEIPGSTLECFADFPLIREFMEATLKNPKEKYSDGERGLMQICTSVCEFDHSDFHVLIIDEILSRIYEDETYGLRSEVLKLLYERSRDNNVITIIVDHIVKLDRITQVDMSLDADGSIKLIERI